MPKVLFLLLALCSYGFAHYTDSLGYTSDGVDCGALSGCSKCSTTEGCLWCAFEKTCANYSEASETACNVTGWCADDSCTCTVFPTTNSIGSMLVMLAFYGLLLGFAAKTIADGSELLLELFPNWSSVIGGLLLPVLGAVPDSAMILVSGINGTPQEAQEQLAVGVGTLAGSTIMLLTVPWTASLFVGRSDIINNGEKIVKKKLTHTSLLQSPAWTKSGIEVDKDTTINARIALGASLSFLLVQVVAFFYLQDDENPTAKSIEESMSLAGMVICGVLFVAYCAYQVIVPTLAEKRKEKAVEAKNERALYLTSLYFVKKLKQQTSMLPMSLQASGLTKVTTDKPAPAIAPKPESSSTPSPSSASSSGANPLPGHSQEAQAAALMLGRRWLNKANASMAAASSPNAPPNSSSSSSVPSPSFSDKKSEVTPLLQPKDEKEDEEDDSDESEEQEEKKDEPFGVTLAKSIAYMLFGLGLVAIFSDPMVDVLAKLGSFLNVPAFYISFIITPLCSNASELIASIVFASKKTVVASSMTYSQLYGASTMNATLGLGIFYALIYFRKLAWTFSAETLAILFVTWAVCGVGSIKRVIPLFWSVPNSLLFPLSLVLVYTLETFAKWK